MVLVSLAFAAGGVPPQRPPCGSFLTLPLLGPAPVLPPPPAAPPTDKQERDATGTYPHQLVGANFVLKWGSRGSVSDAEAAALLEYFEYAWVAEVDGMEHTPPAGSDAYLFNVYVGDTGSGTPEGYGAAGYYNRDDDGYAMIVIAEATLDDLHWARGTVVHEFYHALQDASGRYTYTGDSAWYWEATAMWVEGQVWEDDYDSYYAFLYGYALLPELPVYFFDYPDTGALQEYHQYGAMIFPQYLSEIAADWELVRDSWSLDLGAATPQDAIATLLDERGLVFADVYGLYAAHNASWDYEDGEAYDEWVDWYGSYYPSEDHREVATVEEGTDGIVAAPEETLPQRYGYNVVRARDLSGATATVRFEGANRGSRRSAAEWRFTAVTQSTGVRGYHPVVLTDGAGEVTFRLEAGTAVYLVAAAVPEQAESEETFAWSYSVVTVGEETADPVPDGDGMVYEVDEETGGCGCDGGGAGPSAVVLVGVLLARRRRFGRSLG